MTKDAVACAKQQTKKFNTESIRVLTEIPGI